MSILQQASAFADGMIESLPAATSNRVIRESLRSALIKAFRAGVKASANKKPVQETASSDILHIIEHLNCVTGRKYRVPSGKVLAEMKARLREEGVTVSGVLQMISRQWQVWEGRTGSNGVALTEYVRPSTLFRPDNFNNYYANKDLPVKGQQRRNSLRNLPYHDA